MKRCAEADTIPRRDDRPYLVRGGSFSYYLVLPAFIIVLLILGFPLLFNLYLSFTDASSFTGITSPNFVGLKNYFYVFSENRFHQAMHLVLVWTSSNLALQMTLGLLLAIYLNDSESPLASFFQSVWLIPWVVPGVAAFYSWYLLYHPQIGQFHEWLSGAGIIDRAILADPTNAIWGVIAAAVWKGFPFYMVVFYSGLQAVSPDLYDAARVDGANRWHVFWFIELPELAAVAGPAAVLGFIWIFNWFTPIYVMTEGGPGGTTTTVSYYVFEEALRRFRFGTAAVAGTALVIIVTICFLVFSFLSRQGSE
mgnify:CR=1 FL=1